MGHPDAILDMQDICKAFPGVKALDQVNLTISAGEIHGLVGENGAGKSTIIKVLAGVYPLDSGSITINGQHIENITPNIVHDAGVRFVHQELHLVSHFTVAESVFMGQEETTLLGLKKSEMCLRAEAFLSEALNSNISGNKLIRDLGIAERKLVQIARALIDDKARIVVFDEPTAPLASGEVEQVFKAIRRLKERGIAMIYVSHYLGEITELCDRVTVLRNGQNVTVVENVNTESTDEIIRNMVGKNIDELYPNHSNIVGEAIIDIHQLSDGHKFENINLTVGKGEIVGLAGLIGSGREELTDSIYGLNKAISGNIKFDGKNTAISSASDAVDKGIVLVPRDRRNDGLILNMSVADNINLASLEEVSQSILINNHKLQSRADKLSKELDIRPSNPKAISKFLSGGNQQKVVLARWLAKGAKLFILDEPTVGVDIGAKIEIYQWVQNLAQKGAGIIVSSSDPAELIGLCDRIIVLLRGEIIAEEATNNLTLDSLIALTTSGTMKDAS